MQELQAMKKNLTHNVDDVETRLDGLRYVLKLMKQRRRRSAKPDELLDIAQQLVAAATAAHKRTGAVSR
jgi:hypothetical protein